MKKSGKILLLVGLIMLTAYGASKFWTRGIRNNNPGNIRHNPANDWVGMTGQDKDGFVIFSNAAFGIRAMGRVMDSYQRRGKLSLRDIIETWAPPSDGNDYEGYLAHVMQQTGWQAVAVPRRANGDFVPLVKAIIKHENGRIPYTDKFIEESLAIA